MATSRGPLANKCCVPCRIGIPPLRGQALLRLLAAKAEEAYDAEGR